MTTPKPPAIQVAGVADLGSVGFDAAPTDVFDIVDTAVSRQVLDVPASTTAQPIVSQLTYDSRMETNLYVTRALLEQPTCRILMGDDVIQIHTSRAGVSATTPDGRPLAEAPEVALLLIELLRMHGA